MKAALRHVLADVAGSVGVILAAVIILTTGWELADPIVSILISLLIAASAWSMLRDSVDVLLEAAPRGIDTEEIGYAMASVRGVDQVHDLHVWQITSGMPMLSAHVLVGAARIATGSGGNSRSCCGRTSRSTTRRSRSSIHRGRSDEPIQIGT